MCSCSETDIDLEIQMSVSNFCCYVDLGLVDGVGAVQFLSNNLFFKVSFYSDLRESELMVSRVILIRLFER